MNTRLLELAQRYVESEARQHAPSEEELARDDAAAAATAMALAGQITPPPNQTLLRVAERLAAKVYGGKWTAEYR